MYIDLMSLIKSTTNSTLSWFRVNPPFRGTSNVSNMTGHDDPTWIPWWSWGDGCEPIGIWPIGGCKSFPSWLFHRDILKIQDPLDTPMCFVWHRSILFLCFFCWTWNWNPCRIHTVFLFLQEGILPMTTSFYWKLILTSTVFYRHAASPKMTGTGNL